MKRSAKIRTYPLLLRGCFMGVLLLSYALGAAQDGPSREEAQKRVLAILSGDKSRIPQDAAAQLQQTGWEALAYLEDPEANGEDPVLQQAVGDRYYFGKDSLVVHLKQRERIRAETFTVPFRLSNARIAVAEETGGKQASLWKILYLDAHYLALDMDGLRVFFTQVKYRPERPEDN